MKKEDKKPQVEIRAVNHDEEGRKRVERVGIHSRNLETIKYVERKLEEKGIQRMDRHPADGIRISKPPPKSGHGGKYTWEGPRDLADYDLSDVPAAVDENDPNYVDEEEEEKVLKGKESEAAELVVGEVEVAKAAEDHEGVARVEIDPSLNVN